MEAHNNNNSRSGRHIGRSAIADPEFSRNREDIRDQRDHNRIDDRSVRNVASRTRDQRVGRPEETCRYRCGKHRGFKHLEYTARFGCGCHDQADTCRPYLHNVRHRSDDDHFAGPDGVHNHEEEDQQDRRNRACPVLRRLCGLSGDFDIGLIPVVKSNRIFYKLLPRVDIILRVVGL